MFHKIFLLILFCSDFLINPAFCNHSIVDLDQKNPSLHIIIATTGRSTLIQMLDSLENQLKPLDYITIIFDGRDDDCVYEMAAEKLTKFACTSTIYMEPVNLGYWGHVIRNKYNDLPGDFILHGDDDDMYVPGALSLIRQTVSHDLNALYIFQIAAKNGIISGNPIQLGNISTQNGAIPSSYNSQASWEYYYGGDFAFYQSLSKIVPKIIHVEHVIYRFRP